MLLTLMGADTVPANECQTKVVMGLQGGLEAIQGPPGTGALLTMDVVVWSSCRQHTRAMGVWNRFTIPEA